MKKIIAILFLTGALVAQDKKQSTATLHVSIVIVPVAALPVHQQPTNQAIVIPTSSAVEVTKQQQIIGGQIVQTTTVVMK